MFKIGEVVELKLGIDDKLRGVLWVATSEVTSPYPSRSDYQYFSMIDGVGANKKYNPEKYQNIFLKGAMFEPVEEADIKDYL